MVTTHFCPRNARRNETINIVELGAGDGRKTRILLNALISHRVKFEYIPIDISRKAMTNLFRSMDKAFPKNTLNIHGLIGKYVECLRYIILQHPSRENVVAFIGSSIGNFTGQQASHFLQKLRAQMKPRDVLLLGTDLRKDARVMQKAYSDSKGITREFNLNLLIRLNRELGTNFDLKKFEHVADYNPEIGAMESFLVCNEAHCISMATTESGSRGTTTSHDFMFKQFERIHMEYSHKFTPELVSEMLQIAGYQVKDQYFDNRHWFTDTISVVPDNQHSGAHPENAIHSGFLDMENIQ